MSSAFLAVGTTSLHDGAATLAAITADTTAATQRAEQALGIAADGAGAPPVVEALQGFLDAARDAHPVLANGLTGLGDLARVSGDVYDGAESSLTSAAS